MHAQGCTLRCSALTHAHSQQQLRSWATWRVYTTAKLARAASAVPACHHTSTHTTQSDTHSMPHIGHTRDPATSRKVLAGCTCRALWIASSAPAAWHTQCLAAQGVLTAKCAGRAYRAHWHGSPEAGGLTYCVAACCDQTGGTQDWCHLHIACLAPPCGTCTLHARDGSATSSFAPTHTSQHNDELSACKTATHGVATPTSPSTPTPPMCF